MNNLILPGADGATMTSVDLRDVINTSRNELGESGNIFFVMSLH